MKIINKVHKCTACGCIAFPDATRCPKCDLPYTSSASRSDKPADIPLLLTIMDSRFMNILM